MLDRLQLLEFRQMRTKERYEKALAWFEANMPVAESELNFENEYQLLVAVMLSAQCTDKRVNLVTPALFNAYPTIADLAASTAENVLKYIHSVSYPNSKAEHLVQMAKRVKDVYGGVIPDTREELQTLAGVGRKTANVVLAVWWNQPTMAVDTHIFRVAERIVFEQFHFCFFLYGIVLDKRIGDHIYIDVLIVLCQNLLASSSCDVKESTAQQTQDSTESMIHQ